MGADAAGLGLSRLEQHGTLFALHADCAGSSNPGLRRLASLAGLTCACSGVLLLGMWGEGSGAARGWDMRPRLKEGGGSAR